MSEDKDRSPTIKEIMEADYSPPLYAPRPGTDVNAAKMAHAAQYTAYQLGQINRNLGRLIEVLEANARSGR